MKTVLSRKRKFTYKDVLRVFALFLVHYIALGGFTILLVFINSITNHATFHISVKNNGWMVLMAMIVAPGVNALLHIIYAETGYTNFRASLWIHATFWIITIPILTLFVA